MCPLQCSLRRRRRRARFPTISCPPFYCFSPLFSLFSPVFFSTIFILLANSQPSAVGGQSWPLNCNILDPACRALYRQHSAASIHGSRQRAKCQYQKLWLIPGNADTSCTRPGSKKIFAVDPSQVIIRPDVIELPGCFTIEINNLRVLDDAKQLGSSSFFAKAEYQWWNLKKFSNLKCQNASNDGCGGYGNNCYYCDVCNSLSSLSSEASGSSKFANQFEGLNCPQQPGYYSFRKEFCFNDWSVFDKDGDCQFDFFTTSGTTGLGQYKSALASLQQIGFGTVIAKFRLAHNASGEVLAKRTSKEAEIERTVAGELEERRSSWNLSNGGFDQFRDFYIQYRKDLWHKESYLPWLLYENEVVCLRVTFDVCDKVPTPAQIPFGLATTYTGPRYTCNPSFR